MADFPLEIRGDIALTSERGDIVGLHAAGGVIAVEAASVGALFQLAAFGGGRAGRGARVARAQRLLAAAGLRVEVRLSGRPVAVLAEGTRGGLLARFLGAGPVRLDVAALLRGLLGR